MLKKIFHVVALTVTNKTNSSSTATKQRSATRHEDRASLEKNESKFKVCMMLIVNHK